MSENKKLTLHKLYSAEKVNRQIAHTRSVR